MYTLHVMFPDRPYAGHIESMDDAAQLLGRVKDLLREHDGCEKVVIYAGHARLFSVDCKGNTTPG